MPEDKLVTIKGIGDSVAKKVIEIVRTGKLGALEDIISKTPPGLLEMMNIKGLWTEKNSHHLERDGVLNR